MKILNIKQTDLEHYKFINNGSEAKIYRRGNNIIKVYEEPNEYAAKKIKYLCKLQQNIKKTKLPYGIVNIDNKFSGCIQEYFNEYNELNILSSLSVDENIFFCRMFLENLDELIQNKIYPIDLFYGNVLVSPLKKDIQIIDLDGKGSLIKKNNNKRILQKTLELYLSIVLESLFYKDLDKIGYGNYTSLLTKYRFKYDYVDIIFKNKLSLDFLYEFLEYILKDKKYIFDNNSKILKLN